MPANAGIQESRDGFGVSGPWMPAFAGMTDEEWRGERGHSRGVMHDSVTVVPTNGW